MIWETDDHFDNRIVRYTNWRRIRNCDNLENQFGVFLFADVGHQVMYIGNAGKQRLIDEVISAVDLGKDLEAILVKALYTITEEKAISLERDLINKYKPPNNI